MGKERIKGHQGMGNPWWKETQPRASEVEEFSSPPENKRNDFIVALRGSK